MQEKGLLYFIGEFLNAGLREELSHGEVTHITFDDDTMQLFVTAKFDRYVDDKIILMAKNEVKNALGINKVNLTGIYPSSALTEACAPLLLRVLKENVAAANGFVERAKISIDGESVKFEIFDGADILNEAGAKEFLTKFLF